MPQVPDYNPAPTQTLQPTGVPNLHVDTPDAAFGGTIAKAEQGLGQTLSAAGDEQFRTAIALKTLDNDADARNRSIAVAQQMGVMRDDYMSKQGVDAKNGLAGYQKSVMDLREAALQNTPNPMVRKMLDQELASRMTRDLDFAGGHAATEFRKYLTDTSKAHVNQAIIDAGDNANNPEAYKASLDTIRQEVEHQKGLEGLDPVSAQVRYEELTSKAVAQRAENMARTNPMAASEFLKKAVADGYIHGEHIETTRNKITNALYTTGARNIANTVNSGVDLHWGAGKVSVPMARDAISMGIESGGNYDLIGPKTKHGVGLGKYQVMSEFLPEFLQEAGMPQMSSEAFLKDRAAQDKLFDSRFGGYMDKYGSFNEAASHWFTGKSVADASASGVTDVNKTNVETYLRKTNARLASQMPLTDRVARGKELAEQYAGDAPLMSDYTTSRIESSYNMDKRVRLDDAYQNRQTVVGGIIGGESGKLPTTVDELKGMDPKIADAWDKMENTQKKSMLGYLAQNAKGDHGWTDAGLKTYQQMKGMAQASPAEFLDQDVVGMALPMSARRELINLQVKLKANAESDPRISRAIGVLGPTLNAAGINRTTDPTGYFQFVGALQDAIEEHQRETKKAPNADETRLIGARLLQSQTVPGWIFNSHYPAYQVPVPGDEAESIKADPTWKSLGIVPTDDQVQRIYTRKLYQKLYGGTPAKKAEGPQVPQSR